MRRFRWFAAGLILAVPLSAQPPMWVNPLNQAEDDAFWRDRDFSVSRPIPFPEGAAAFIKDAGSANAHFTSSRLIPKEADLAYPYRTVGKILISADGGPENVSCSGALIKPRIVLTAGHCVHKGSGGTAGYFHSFRFVPAYRDGQMPYGSWGVQYVLVTSTWYTGAGKLPNAADYALLVLRDNIIDGTSVRAGSLVV